MKRLFFILVVLAASLAAWTGPSAGLELRGTVQSGSTGRPVSGVTVEAVNPHKGMVVEQTFEVTDGTFGFSGLNDSIRVYVIRVNHLDVSYSELIVLREEAPKPITFTVYDTTSAWSGVTVSLPNFYVKREQNHLRVEKIYEIKNQSDPPRTVTGSGLTVYIPEDHLSVNSSFTMEHNIPIQINPHKTEDPGMYHLHYPFKPGVTRLALSYSLPYEDGAYSYREKLPVALELIRFITDDPDLKISSQVLAKENTEQARGFFSYSASDLDRSALLSVEFSGGEAPAGGHDHNDGRRVVVRPVAMDGGTVPVTAFLVVVLIGLAVFAMVKPARPGSGRRSTRDARESLLNKIARLDDLKAADAVPETPYRVKRIQLKNELLALYGSSEKKTKEV